jgi:hypothetical protein
MFRTVIAIAIFILSIGPFEGAIAAPVSEATVEKACGDKIQGGCAGDKCATGCTKVENGQLYDYGCTFSNKTGKTKAVCNKIKMRTVTGQGKPKPTGVGGTLSTSP